MKVSYKKNKIALTESTVDVNGSILTNIALIAFALFSIVTTTFSIWTIAGAMLLLAAIKFLYSQKTQKSLEITSKGISIIEDGEDVQFFEIENIKTLFIQYKLGRTKIFINNNEKSNFILSGYYSARRFAKSTASTLKLNIKNYKKTSLGRTYELVSQEIIDQQKNNFELSNNSEHPIAKSKLYSIENKAKILVIKNLNRNGVLANKKLTLDLTNQVLIIDSTNFPTKEISIHSIKEIRIAIDHKASGSNSENITGQLIAFSTTGEKILIFHCEISKSNILDFAEVKLKNDLIALKATIDMKIKQNIDKSLESLDLGTLKENLEKQKDILPNQNESTL